MDTVYGVDFANTSLNFVEANNIQIFATTFIAELTKNDSLLKSNNNTLHRSKTICNMVHKMMKQNCNKLQLVIMDSI